jgi:hypothetical protein
MISHFFFLEKFDSSSSKLQAKGIKHVCSQVTDETRFDDTLDCKSRQKHHDTEVTAFFTDLIKLMS